MKILVCGGRHYNRKQFLFKCLTMVHNKYNIKCVVHGDASGADSLAKEWAISNGIEHIPYPANWKLYGPSAGPIRNALMLQENADIALVIAFPGGSGTFNMIGLAKSKNIRVINV
jgi:hypothetical protein